MACCGTGRRREASFVRLGFPLKDSEEALRNVGVSSGLAIVSEAGLGEASIN